MTAEERLRLINNPYANVDSLSLADLSRRMAPPEPPSLAQQKSSTVSEKLAEKQSSLFNQIDVGALNGSSSGGNDYLNMIGADILRLGGSVADLGRGASNKLFGTDFDDSRDSGWSNLDNADMAAGVSTQAREKLNKKQEAVFDAVEAGDWLGALGATASAALGTAASSGGSLIGMAAGAAMTGGLSLAATGIRGAAVAKNVATGAKAVDSVNDAVKASKSLTMATNALKATSNSSFLSADIIQQVRDEYKLANNGEEMSAGRLAASTVLVSLTATLQFDIAKRFYVPKVLRTDKKVADKVQEFHADVKKMVERAEPGVFKNLVVHSVRGVPAVFAAGGAEAVQEYAQQWAQTLSVNVKPTETKSLMDSIMEQFRDEGNINEAIASAFLGAGAGGATKAVMSAPGTVLGATAEAAVGTQKKINNALAEKAIDTSNKYLDKEAMASLNAEKANALELHEEVKKDREAKYVALTSAKTVSDLQGNPELLEYVISRAPEADLSDPKQFQSVVKAAISQTKADVFESQAAISTKFGAGVLKEAAKGAGRAAVDGAKAVAKAVPFIEEKHIDAALSAIKTVSKATIDEVKNIEESSIRSLVVDAAKVSEKGANAVASMVYKKYRDVPTKQLQKLADTVREEAPNIATGLDKFVAERVKAEEKRGLRSDTEINSDNLAKSIQAASSGILPENAMPSLSQELRRAAKGNINSNAAKRIQKALEVYQKSSHATTSAGRLTPSEIKGLKEKIELSNTAKRAANKAVDKVSKTAEKVVDKVEKAVIGEEAQAEKKAAKAEKKAEEVNKAEVDKKDSEGNEGKKSLLKKLDDAYATMTRESKVIKVGESSVTITKGQAGSAFNIIKLHVDSVKATDPKQWTEDVMNFVMANDKLVDDLMEGFNSEPVAIVAVLKLLNRNITPEQEKVFKAKLDSRKPAEPGKKPGREPTKVDVKVELDDEVFSATTQWFTEETMIDKLAEVFNIKLCNRG
jgi:hypothetical protein